METLDKHFRRLAAQAFKAHGFATADLLSHWPEIVGEATAGLCRPERVKWTKPGNPGDAAPGTLTVKAVAGRSLDVQYAAESILERINQFMGYRAIARLKVTTDTQLQAPAKAAKVPEPPVALPPLPEGITDSDLKAALARLGSGILSDPARPRSPQEK